MKMTKNSTKYKKDIVNGYVYVGKNSQSKNIYMTYNIG